MMQPNNQFSQDQISYQISNFDPSKTTTTTAQQYQTNQQIQQNQNIQFNNARAPPWQQQEQQVQQQIQSNNMKAMNALGIAQVQNINCQTFDRVPPLHQHMPQDNNVWANDEVARKKAKIVKNSFKKQRQHSNNMNCNLDQGLTGDEINSQSGKNFSLIHYLIEMYQFKILLTRQINLFQVRRSWRIQVVTSPSRQLC